MPFCNKIQALSVKTGGAFYFEKITSKIQFD